MNKFIHSIKFKFILAFGLCIALLVATGAFAIISLSRLSNNMNDMYHLNTVPISVLDTVKYNHAVVRLLTRRLQLAIDDNDIKQSDQIAQEILDTKNIMNQAWNEYYPDLLSNDAERSVAQKVSVYIPQFNSVVTDILSAYKANDLERLDADCIKLAKIGDVLDALLRENIEVNLAMARNFAERADANSRTLLGIAIALVSLGVLLSIVATFSLMRAISRPLAMAVSIAKEIAAGRLDNTIPVTSKDEFGQLLVSLQAMDNHLSSVVREIKHSTESVSVASQEIAGGNLDLSARTEQQAASLEQTAASVTELTETVKQNADSALQASSLANDATNLANAGNLAVQAMVETVDRINASSNKIAEITGLIEGIAFQTNILALNAAVEAARAGEQGRGFAVVASEVRTLAQRSSSAAKEIKTLIDASVTLTRDGSKQAEGVGGTMEQVREAIQKVSSIVSEIATASAEQSQGIEQVHQAVSQMDDVTQQNAALVEQSAAAAQSLEEQAMHLKQVVAVFQMAGSHVTQRTASAQLRTVQASPFAQLQQA